MDEGKSNLQKENGDLRASLREVERSRLEARRELQELRRQVKINNMKLWSLIQLITILHHYKI